MYIQDRTAPPPESDGLDGDGDGGGEEEEAAGEDEEGFAGFVAEARMHTHVYMRELLCIHMCRRPSSSATSRIHAHVHAHAHVHVHTHV